MAPFSMSNKEENIMLETKIYADAWKTIRQIHKECDTPSECAERILAELGDQTSLEVLSAVVQLKPSDGRIHPHRRKFLYTISVNPDAVLWDHSNPLVYAGLDDIHTTHLDRVITYILRLTGNKAEAIWDGDDYIYQLYLNHIHIANYYHSSDLYDELDKRSKAVKKNR